MTVYELNRDQLDELKTAYFWGEDTQHIPKYRADGLPALFPGDIPDGVIYRHYVGIDFVNDDFSCTAGHPDESHPLRVCPRCLQAIESHEGRQVTRPLYYFDGDEIPPCDWCDESENDVLYEIL